MLGRGALGVSGLVEQGFKPVVRLFVNQATSLVHLSYRRETRSADGDSEGGEAGDGDEPEASTLTGTPEHPFWSVTRQAFVGMGTLKPGERLLLADGSAATVTASRVEQLAKPVKVYNFEVADWHTYFVTANKEAAPVWVHNLCALGSIKALKSLKAEAATKGTDLYKLLKAQRRTAVKQAWAAEKALVNRTGEGTVDWTGFQKLQLRAFGRVFGYQGHHINNVRHNPYMAAWQNNVRFMTRSEHFAAHGGNWRNRTFGDLIDRSFR